MLALPIDVIDNRAVRGLEIELVSIACMSIWIKLGSHRSAQMDRRNQMDIVHFPDGIQSYLC